MNKNILIYVSVLFSAPLRAITPDTVEISSESNIPLSSVQTAPVAITPEPQTTPDNTAIQATFGKEVTEDSGLSGNLFGGFRPGDTTTSDDGHKLESNKEAGTSISTDLTPISMVKPLDHAQLDSLTVQQLRDLMQKMKIAYRLIDSKEVLIRKILAHRGH